MDGMPSWWHDGTSSSKSPLSATGTQFGVDRSVVGPCPCTCPLPRVCCSVPPDTALSFAGVMDGSAIFACAPFLARLTRSLDPFPSSAPLSADQVPPGLVKHKGSQATMDQRTKEDEWTLPLPLLSAEGGKVELPALTLNEFYRYTSRKSVDFTN